MKEGKAWKSFREGLCSNSGVCLKCRFYFWLGFVCVCVCAHATVFQMLYFWDMLAVEGFKIRFLEIRLWELLATRRRLCSEHLYEVWRRLAAGGRAREGCGRAMLVGSWRLPVQQVRAQSSPPCCQLPLFPVLRGFWTVPPSAHADAEQG